MMDVYNPDIDVNFSGVIQPDRYLVQIGCRRLLTMVGLGVLMLVGVMVFLWSGVIFG